MYAPTEGGTLATSVRGTAVTASAKALVASLRTCLPAPIRIIEKALAPRTSAIPGLAPSPCLTAAPQAGFSSAFTLAAPCLALALTEVGPDGSGGRAKAAKEGTACKAIAATRPTPAVGATFLEVLDTRA